MKFESKYEIGQELWEIFENSDKWYLSDDTALIKGILVEENKFIYYDVFTCQDLYLTHRSNIVYLLSESDIDHKCSFYYTTREAAIAEVNRLNMELESKVES